MAHIEIEDTIFDQFVLSYPDPITRQQIATMQIAKLLKPMRNQPQLHYTTIALSDEMRDYLNERSEELGIKRKEYISQLIWDASLERLAGVLNTSMFYMRSEDKAENGLKNASFSPDRGTFEHWAKLARSLKVSKQFLVEFLIKEVMAAVKEDEKPEPPMQPI
jgi:hypothetical protein